MGNKIKQGLLDAVKKMNDPKAFGANHIGTVKTMENIKVERVSSGLIDLDIALGGGFVKQGMVEIWGPESSGKTSLFIQVMKHFQKIGLDQIAFIDHEHSFDLDYAADCGVDIDNILISQPESGEDGLATAKNLIRTKELNLLIFDSVAAMKPRKELVGAIEDIKMSRHANMMGIGVNQINNMAKKNGTLVVWINQIREKIGVMFGCFPYHGKVMLSNGKSMNIGKIVNDKLSVEVMSYNFSTGKLETKKVVNWFNNGRYDQLVKVSTLSPHKSGNASLNVADDHTFITNGGDKKLSELSVGDMILTPSKHFLNRDQKEVVFGGILGDGSIRTKNGTTYIYRECHAISQNRYCEWKAEILNKFISTSNYNKKGQFWFECHTTTEISEFEHIHYDRALRKITEDQSKWITPISLAIWYMDDGTFSGSYEKWGHGKSVIYARCIDKDSKNIIKNRLNELGLDVSLTRQGFSFSGKNCRNFQKLIAQYIHPSMSYKIHPNLTNLCGKYTYDSVNIIKDVMIEVPILKIENVKKKRSPYKYDIEVEGNSNYLVSGILVHNSPEKTTGGNALKFFCLQRLEIRRAEWGAKEKGTEFPNSSKHKITIKKNKAGKPMRKVTIMMKLGEGFSEEASLLNVAIEGGVIEKSGSWYSYNKTKMGQGEATAIQFLVDNPEVTKEIDGIIRKELGI